MTNPPESVPPAMQMPAASFSILIKLFSHVARRAALYTVKMRI